MARLDLIGRTSRLELFRRDVGFATAEALTEMCFLLPAHAEDVRNTKVLEQGMER